LAITHTVSHSIPSNESTDVTWRIASAALLRRRRDSSQGDAALGQTVTSGRGTGHQRSRHIRDSAPDRSAFSVSSGPHRSAARACRSSLARRPPGATGIHPATPSLPL